LEEPLVELPDQILHDEVLHAEADHVVHTRYAALARRQIGVNQRRVLWVLELVSNFVAVLE
jgi:hypothetical protein